MKKLVALAIGALLILAPAAAGCGKAAAGDTLDKAQQKFNEIKSAHMEFDAQLEIKGDLPAGTDPAIAKLMPFRFGAKGNMDYDESSGKARMKGNLKIEGLGELVTSLAGTGETADIASVLQMSVVVDMLSDLDFAIIDDKAYFKMAGTWYEADASTASISGLGGISTTPGISTTGDKTNQECFKKAFDDPARFAPSTMLKDIQELSEEKIDGVDTRHFKANANMDKILDEVSKVLRECGEAETAGAFEAARSDITKMLKKLEIEMWVDKDNNFRQVKVNADVDLSSLGDLATAFGGEAGAGDTGSLQVGVTASVKFSRLGETFDIKAPENPIPFEKLFGDLSGLGSLGAGLDLGGLEGGTGTTGTGTSTSPSTR